MNNESQDMVEWEYSEDWTLEDEHEWLDAYEEEWEAWIEEFDAMGAFDAEEVS
jgi:hypothetical protein